MVLTHHGTSTNRTRFIVSVKGTPIRKDLGIRSPGRPRGTNESFCYVASRYVGGVETRQAANQPGLDDCRPTQDSRMRGDASRGRKSFMFESKFCQSTSSFLQKRRSFLGPGPALVTFWCDCFLGAVRLVVRWWCHC